MEKSLNEYNSTLTQAMKWLITVTVMLAAIIEIVDTTIVNVVLHNMAGTLGASTENITWVSTSYIVAAAIMMPLTGILVRIMGRKRLLLVNIIGFLVFSMLCGMANSLTEIVIFRIFQGIFGASLVPLSMYILQDTFSPAEQVKAMAVWGMGIMVAPVLGPTLGGYIASSLSWRWVFYINIPVCLIAIVMTYLFIQETKRERAPIDWVGLALIIITVGAFQVFLDRGNSDGWLQSNFIMELLLTSILGFVIFMVRGLYRSNNIINLKVFADRDYYAASLLLIIFVGVIFGIIVLQPLVMEGFLNYSTKLTGIMMAPRGLAIAVAMMLVAMLSKRMDMRYLIGLGIIVMAIGTSMLSKLSLQSDSWNIIYPELIQGLGMGLSIVPISAMALQNLKSSQIAEASGLFSFSRNMGTSIGVSILVTVMTRETQVAWHSLAGKVSMLNPNYHIWLQHTHFAAKSTATAAVLGGIITNQASMIGFDDACYLGVWVLLLSLPLVFLLRKPK